MISTTINREAERKTKEFTLINHLGKHANKDTQDRSKKKIVRISNGKGVSSPVALES